MNICLIGLGKLGYNLYYALQKTGHTVVQVYNRTLPLKYPITPPMNSAPNFFINDLQHINNKADIYIISVSDSAIELVSNELFEALQNPNAVVVHTSGSTPSTALQQHLLYGIFYPLQTFNVQNKVNFNEIPICIHGNNEQVTEKIKALANTLTPKVYYINDDQRKTLHVAAVFANNFTNYLMGVAEYICQSQSIDFEILKPLIAETFNKIQHLPPFEIQTGPARRNDMLTIKKHLFFLSQNYPTLPYEPIYNLISQSIVEQYFKK